MDLGKKITYYKEVDSTQLEIFRRIENNTIKNEEVIVAGLQTGGMRNSW